MSDTDRWVLARYLVDIRRMTRPGSDIRRGAIGWVHAADKGERAPDEAIRMVAFIGAAILGLRWYRP